jgi:hypothetical protein
LQKQALAPLLVPFELMIELQLMATATQSAEAEFQVKPATHSQASVPTMTPFELITWEQSRTHTADPHKKPGLQKQALSPLLVPFENCIFEQFKEVFVELEELVSFVVVLV